MNPRIKILLPLLFQAQLKTDGIFEQLGGISVTLADNADLLNRISDLEQQNAFLRVALEMVGIACEETA